MRIKTKYVVYVLRNSGRDGYFISLKEGLLGVWEINLADSTRRAKWFDTEESASFLAKKLERSLGCYTEVRPTEVEFFD